MFFAFPIVVMASEEVPEGYTVVNGNENGSLADAFRTTKEQNNENINANIMAEADKHITSFAGTITSCIIYLIFALTGLSTAIDLLYFAVPTIRPYLYDAPQKPMQNGVGMGYGMPMRGYGGGYRPTHRGYGGYNRRRY